MKNGSERPTGRTWTRKQGSSKLLIEEPPLMVLPSLVQAVGLEQSIVLQQIKYLLTMPNSGIDRDGYHWIWNTAGEFHKRYFPFWHPTTISHLLRQLEKKRVLVSAQFDAAQWKRHKFYRIDYDRLNELLAEQWIDGEPNVDNNTFDDKSDILSSIQEVIECQSDTHSMEGRIDSVPYTEITTENTSDIALGHNESTYPIEDGAYALNQTTTQSSKPANPDPKVLTPLQAFIETYYSHLGYACTNWGKEGSAVKWLMANGYSVEQAMACWDYLETDAWWMDKPVDLAVIRQQVGNWVRLGCPAFKANGKSNGNGKVIPDEEYNPLKPMKAAELGAKIWKEYHGRPRTG